MRQKCGMVWHGLPRICHSTRNVESRPKNWKSTKIQRKYVRLVKTLQYNINFFEEISQKPLTFISRTYTIKA